MCDGSGEWFRRRKRRRVKEKEVKTSVTRRARGGAETYRREGRGEKGESFG